MTTLRLTMLVVPLIALVIACGDDVPRDRVLADAWTPLPPDASDTDSGSDAGITGTCTTAITSEHLPAREIVMATGGATSESTGVFTSELYGQFVDYCGSCHTQGRNQGGFDVSRATFVEKITDEVIERARSDDPEVVMPPMSVPFSMRDPQAPIVKFVDLLTQWYAAGKPPDVFQPAEPDDGDGEGASPYRLNRMIGMGLTNLGHCVPNKALVLASSDAARALDQRFEAIERFTDLPKTLQQTDVTTFDTVELAKHGVIAFAPTYTLWADNAKKIRFIRVPVGQSVRFDRDAQSFDIPANTRFYKTFLKRVVDLQGNARYRKMETRIIISRPDRVLDDGSLQHTAIFGTYKWNDAETEATLHETPYRDGDGFTDDLRVYAADERLEDQIVRAAPERLDEALLEAGARRTYAMPGADRCIDCHMGSKSFILGFTPLQVRRRPLGQGGVIEPAVGDELNQLQRLIDYGVITGLRAADEVTGLEHSQGARAPRNEHELNAQGYMLGNCAHCHNPNGFPSRREPILRDVLSFLPSATGGIFQFPLDKFSPRTFRGTLQDIRIPYITPSLFDHPEAVASNDENSGAISRSNKWITLANPTAQDHAGVDWIRNLPLRTALPSLMVGDLGSEERADPTLIPRKYFDQFALMNIGPGRPLLAPWRSLIYRNVDTPFSYEDGGTIFPRMPMDTPGYDCRARRVMGLWMTSIPARFTPTPFEAPHGTRLFGYPGLEHYDELFDTEDQPYVEAHVGDADYDAQVVAANARVAMFRSSERYNDCPSPDLDGVAPEVSSGRSVVPTAQLTRITDDDGVVTEVYDLLSPARPHYPKTDLRDDPQWVIRRPDWLSVLVTDQVDPAKAAQSPDVAFSSADTIATVRQLDVNETVEALLLTERPFGLWQAKPECAERLAQEPSVSDFSGTDSVGADAPTWLSVTQPDSEAAVYMISPGAQVFEMICSRCHGPEANGKSALSTTIADLTGGLSRVANLRDGLFGPPSAPGSQWLTEFGRTDDGEAASRTWAARYIAWMGLGGTNTTIPPAVLTKLRSAQVLGEAPQGGGAFRPSAQDAANMLTVAKLACQVFLPARPSVFDAPSGRFVRESDDTTELRTIAARGLITRNGVADLWEMLCHLNNAGPVRRLDIDLTKPDKPLFVQANMQSGAQDRATAIGDVFERSAYPADAPVGDQHGRVTRGIQPDNLAPWCVYPNLGADKEAVVAAIARRMHLDDLPRCPTAAVQTNARWTNEQGLRWAIRGAANAGLAVFVYLDALSKGQVQRKPTYDRCEELQ